MKLVAMIFKAVFMVDWENHTTSMSDGTKVLTTSFPQSNKYKHIPLQFCSFKRLSLAGFQAMSVWPTPMTSSAMSECNAIYNCM